MSGEATKKISKEELWGGGRSPLSMSYGKMMMWFFLVSDGLTFGGLLLSLTFMRQKYADVWPISEDVFHSFPGTHAHLPLLYVALMTFILIVSSVTMVLAVEAGHRMDKKNVIFWMALTVIGGFFFLGSQVWEWSHFIHGTEHGVWEFANNVRGHLVDGSGAMVSVFGDGVSIQLLDNIDGTSGGLVTGVEAQSMYNEFHNHIHGANLTENEYGLQLYGNFFFFITGFHGFHVFTGVMFNLIIMINCIKGIYHDRGHYEMVEKTGLYWHFVDLVWVFVFTIFYLL
jgi:cytochrome c oxidase subunit 3